MLPEGHLPAPGPIPGALDEHPVLIHNGDAGDIRGVEGDGLQMGKEHRAAADEALLVRLHHSVYIIIKFLVRCHLAADLQRLFQHTVEAVGGHGEHGGFRFPGLAQQIVVVGVFQVALKDQHHQQKQKHQGPHNGYPQVGADIAGNSPTQLPQLFHMEHDPSLPISLYHVWVLITIRLFV